MIRHRPKLPHLVLAVVATAGGACSNSSGSGSSSSQEEGGSGPVVSQARISSAKPFGSREQGEVDAAYAPGSDAALTVWKSRFTLTDGTVAVPATMSGSIIPAGVTQTSDLQLVSPLVQFQAKDAGGKILPRATLKKEL